MTIKRRPGHADGRDWRGADTESQLKTCSFCGKARPRAKMIETPDGLYCRQCWLDHWL